MIPILGHNSNGISIGAGVFAGLTSVTDRQTNRPRYSVGNNRPHLCTYLLRRGLKAASAISNNHVLGISVKGKQLF